MARQQRNWTAVAATSVERRRHTVGAGHEHPEAVDVSGRTMAVASVDTDADLDREQVRLAVAVLTQPDRDEVVARDRHARLRLAGGVAVGVSHLDRRGAGSHARGGVEEDLALPGHLAERRERPAARRADQGEVEDMGVVDPRGHLRWRFRCVDLGLQPLAPVQTYADELHLAGEQRRPVPARADQRGVGERRAGGDVVGRAHGRSMPSRPTRCRRWQVIPRRDGWFLDDDDLDGDAVECGASAAVLAGLIRRARAIWVAVAT